MTAETLRFRNSPRRGRLPFGSPRGAWWLARCLGAGAPGGAKKSPDCFEQAAASLEETNR